MKIDNLEQLRKQKKITGADMARKINVSRQCYFQYEHNSNIPLDKYIQICEIMNISLPRDFHLYNGYLLAMNKLYYKISIEELSEVFDVGKRFFSQIKSTDNLYEYKDSFFKAFQPLIYPCVVDDLGMPVLYDAINRKPTVEKEEM